jgi:murein L,D-transpeptidase YafK
MGLCTDKSRLPLRYAGLIALGSIATLGAAHGKGVEHGRQAARHIAADVTKRASLPAIGGAIGAAAPDAQQRLEQKGMTAGSPVMIRIFKAESELELWLETHGRFELFATYAICFWSGTLGPKLREGDRQAPEGLYTVGLQQLRRTGKRPRSFDIGYPNALDQAEGRTGSNIWIHGGCTSIGCYAMTDSVMGEIYALGEQALVQGQDRFQVQVFPFRMTEENMLKHAVSPWLRFWTNLKEAYDAFERTRIPPKVAICGGRYLISEAALGSERNLILTPEAPLSTCDPTGIDPAPLIAKPSPVSTTRRHASRRSHPHHAGGHSRRRAHLVGHRTSRSAARARHRHAPRRADRSRAAHHVPNSLGSRVPRFVDAGSRTPRRPQRLF